MKQSFSMGEVVPTRPTVVFSSEELSRNGLVHWVIQQDAVPSRRSVLITTACGLQSIGVVKLRRGFNCQECRDAEDRANATILKHAEKVDTIPL